MSFCSPLWWLTSVPSTLWGVEEGSKIEGQCGQLGSVVRPGLKVKNSKVLGLWFILQAPSLICSAEKKKSCFLSDFMFVKLFRAVCRYS